MLRPKNRAAKIVALLKEGLSPKEILKEVPSITGATVTYWRKRLGFASFRKGQPRGPRKKEAAAAVMRLKHEGLSYSQIGKKLGFSAQNAYRYAAAQKPVYSLPMQGKKTIPSVPGLSIINCLYASVKLLEPYPDDPEAQKLTAAFNDLIDRIYAKTQPPTKSQAKPGRARRSDSRVPRKQRS
jgi:hypothetical protein